MMLAGVYFTITITLKKVVEEFGVCWLGGGEVGNCYGFKNVWHILKTYIHEGDLLILPLRLKSGFDNSLIL